MQYKINNAILYVQHYLYDLHDNIYIYIYKHECTYCIYVHTYINVAAKQIYNCPYVDIYKFVCKYENTSIKTTKNLVKPIKLFEIPFEYTQSNKENK